MSRSYDNANMLSCFTKWSGCALSAIAASVIAGSLFPNYRAQAIEVIVPMTESCYTMYDVPLSAEVQRYAQDVCEEYMVSYPLVLAIIQKESRYQADIVSETGDYGLMQINAGNHQWLAKDLGITDFLDQEQNILSGVYILSQLGESHDIHPFLMRYNCGPARAKKLLEDGITSTAYSRSVIEILDRLEVMELE